MSNYLLKILIDTDTTKLFNEKSQKIVIVKQNDTSSVSSVAWVTFKPFENNTVSWEQIYGLYASYSEVQGKAKITTSSYITASAKNTYPFQNGVFGSPTPDSTLSDNTYEVVNKASDYKCLTFGLAQNVMANGVSYEGNPVNATTVLPNEVATFTPVEKIRVFMQADIDNGVVISQIRSQPLDIQFTNQSEVTIKYDNGIGGFIQI